MYEFGFVDGQAGSGYDESHDLAPHLSGLADQARLVRRFVGFLLDGSPLAEDVVFAAAELAANAIRNTRSGLPGGAFTVEARRWSDDVAVAVTDRGAARGPALGDAGDLSESGRGLRAIQATAYHPGWTGDERARTYVLAQGAALTGVLNEHRFTPTASGPVVCATCGTIESCRTLRRIDGAFAAYLTGGPPGVDMAEAWRRADAWFNTGPDRRVTVMVEEAAGAYLAWAVPRPPCPDERRLLVIDRRTGRLISAPDGR